MIKQLFNSRQNTIASAAVIVASFSVLSRFVGFIRDRILAGTFGAGDALDIYFAAFRVPDFIFQLVITGALSASFIPLFTKYFGEKKNDDAWFLTNNILNILLLSFAVLIAIGAILAPQLAPLIAPGFNEAKQMAVADLARVMFLAQFFLAASMVYGSALQGAKRFILYSSAPIFYNLGIIVGVIFLAPTFGIIGVAWGVVLGAILHFLLQLLGVKTLGYKYRPIFKFNKDIKYTLKHMIPRTMGLAVNQINFLVMTIIASTLAVGSVTVLQFAYNLNFFPVGVIAVSFAIAAFPTFCDLSNSNDREGFIKAFSSTVRQMLLFIVPATFCFILLRAQVVRVVLGSGQFDWEATILTANLLGLFTISLIAQSIVFLLVRAYFAYHDTLTPFFVGLGAATVNIIAALFFSAKYGVIGLGIAFSLAALVQVVLLWVPLRQRIGSLDEWRIFKSGLILLIAGLVGALVLQAVKMLFGQVSELDTFIAILVQSVVAGTVGIVAYVLVAYTLKSSELDEFINGMKKRLIKKAKIEEEIVTHI